ncbi:MAG: ferredoxin:glutaredoxin reductase [Elusimicrobia bacterium]|nr:ferredoxin:glutaredoxin reductase [Elusimicrobiota bacterium]
MPTVTAELVDAQYRALKDAAEHAGYHLNPDESFVKDIVRGMIENEQRYGYQSCPCRLSAANKDADRDIVCPCDYRDADITAYGACYCALYVSQKVVDGTQTVSAIPERRPPLSRRTSAAPVKKNPLTSLSVPVWRCTVCGYLCGREQPPDVCPICKVKKDRFERFM